VSNYQEIAATDLQAAFEANNLRAETTYSDQTYTVTGVFDGAETGLFGSGVIVRMAGGSFMADMTDAEKPRAAQLNRGDEMRVRCTLKGTILGTPVGRDCHLVTSDARAAASDAFVTSPSVTHRGPEVPLPSYDISRFCSAKVDEKACVEDQYSLRSAASMYWKMISPAARAECVSSSQWNDYNTLRDCAESHKDDSKLSMAPAVPIVAPVTTLPVPIQNAPAAQPTTAPAPSVPAPTFTLPPAQPAPAAAVPNFAPPHPVAAPPADPNFASFTAGKTRRMAWETFFGSIAGDEHDGALWWAGQRSLKAPGSCATGRNDQYRRGCEEAQAILGPSDVLRKTNPAFRAGWNSL